MVSLDARVKKQRREATGRNLHRLIDRIKETTGRDVNITIAEPVVTAQPAGLCEKLTNFVRSLLPA